MAITTKDIARICGVSRGTVDRALNNKARISPETKEKIVKTAAELGYRPDLLARGLVTGTSMTVGIVVCDLQNRHFAQMVNAMTETARKQNYFVNISVQDQRLDLELRIIDSMVSRRVDGLIVSPVNKGPEFEDYLRSLPIPVVLLGNDNAEDISHVGIDEKQAGKDAAKLILSKGYRHLVFVVPPLAERAEMNRYGHERRLEGFMEAVAEQEGAVGEVINDWNYVQGAKKLMSQYNHPQSKAEKIAFLCTADIYALEIMHTLKQEGYRPKRDYGLMGFDNIDILDFITPKLATVDNAVRETGRQAMEMLLHLIAHESTPKGILLPHNIVKGETL